MADRAIAAARTGDERRRLHRMASPGRPQSAWLDEPDPLTQGEQPVSRAAARRRVLGLPVSVVTPAGLLDAISGAVETRTPTVFVGLYAALFRATASDADYRELVASSVTYPDGQGLVVELQRRGVTQAQRLATTDMVHPIIRLAAQRGWRIGLYGSAPGVADRAAAKLSAAVSGADIVAVWDGYSGGPSTEQLQAARLDVLFVALGAHRQERWAHSVAAVAGVPAVLTCGGLLDFVAGDKRRAPRWMQRLALEWAFRVLLEPRRLLTRYLLGNTYFLWHARKDRFHPVAPGN
jgi:N-acetylglucosaminyldiphosphoundecaprenol N-acetyl-beta-D-mannosaminyltransferase